MEKKGATLLLVLAVMVLTEATVVFASADVAYIYRKDFKVDHNILRIFNESNLTYDLIDERNLPTNFGQYKLLFVGDENFRYENRILVNQFPSIVANYYHAGFWGFTDAEGVSQLGASHPLSVKKNGRMIQVYTQAEKWPDGPSTVYYFLDEENKAPGLQTSALTESTASGDMFGDVISYAPAGASLFGGKTQQAKLCFFGIIESDYWTPAAKDLFRECLGYVGAECEINDDCPDPEYSSGFCQAGNVYRNVTRYSCQLNNAFKECVPNQTIELIEDCPFDCQNGQCVGECERDSDCGQSGPIDGLFCIGKNVTQIFKQFTCVNPNTPQSHCITEITNQTQETCEDVCINGSCQDIECFTNADCSDLNSSTEDTCHSPGTVDSFCTNEPIACFNNQDCGTDGFKGNPFCVGVNVTRLFESFTCRNPGTAASSCTSTQEQRIIQECAAVCISGACQDIECYHDSDCADSNPLTYDQCINPGTVVSECRNTPINCASDGDCGFTGYMGEEYCSSDGNVSKNFQTADCVSPGQLNSYCDLSVIQQLINQCDYACFDGTCIRCDSNTDCDDSNSETIDLCQNPGALSSYCTNEEPQGNVTCSRDSDCGANTYLGSQFCAGLDISQLFQTWDCNNPGTSQSYCSTNLIVQLLQTCSDYCLDGECVEIECFINSDCNDGNPSTTDLCHNPGTPQSFCTNEPTGGSITCTGDLDCGVDTPISPLFCSDTNISQLIRTWDCKNQNTLQSYCSSNIIIDMIQSCPEYCADGECVEIECFTNHDCDDSNQNTFDVCVNPGTLESYCTNNPFEITCYQDLDCGIDGFVGDTFCLANNVTKLFQQFECNVPGTQQSYCSTSISEVAIEECENLCVNGQCIPQQGECTPGQIRPCGSDVGECSVGINVCFISSEWSEECFGEIPPAAEICDGKDNDCDGQTDEGGVCSGGCTNECSLGNRRCNGNGYQLCGNFDADSCSEWSQITSCLSTEICTNGYCVTEPPSCQDECTLGQRECSGNGYKLCANFDADSCSEWSLPTSCLPTETCTGGFCVPDEPSCQNECIAGQRRCNGNGYQLCANFDADSCSEWSLPTSCLPTQICTNGYCID